MYTYIHIQIWTHIERQRKIQNLTSERLVVCCCHLYRANGFAEFRSCGTYHERKLVLRNLRFSIDPYGRTPDFSLPFGKYWSNLHTVSEKKFCLDPKMSVGGAFFAKKCRNYKGAGEPLFCHRRQCEIRYQLPVTIGHARCRNSWEQEL